MPSLSLRTKFILTITAILLVIFALTAYFSIRNARITLTNNLNGGSKAFAGLATQPIGSTYEVYQNSGTLRITQQMQQFTSLDSNVTNIAVVGVDGGTAYTLNPTPQISASASQAASSTPSYTTNANGQIVQIVEPYIDSYGFHSYAVVYRISTSEVDQAIRSEELSILIFAILGLIISALGAYEFINHFFLRPMDQVSHWAQVIAAGYYNEPLPFDRHDEIGVLASSVERMSDTLKANIAQLEQLDKLKTEFIMITSHNLRTPLTIIEGNLSMIAEAKLSSDMQDMVTAIDQSARRLNIFSEQMITIANVEAGHRIDRLDKVQLGELIKPISDEFAKLAKDKKIEFKAMVKDEQTQMSVNRNQLGGALRNILDNAFKFTPEKGSINLSAAVEGEEAVFKISDTGAGIKEEEQAKLFTKFHRGTDTLTYNYEGTGIGLYVVKLIVDQHGGTVSASSQVGKGTTFTVKIPLRPKP